MRKLLTLLALTACLSSTMSCSTISKTKEKLDYLNQKIDNVRDYTDQQLVKLEEKAEKTESDLADVGITLDTDLDGKVSKEEAMAAAKDVVTGALTDSGKRKLLTDPEFWVGLGGAVVVSITAVVKASQRRRKKAAKSVVEA